MNRYGAIAQHNWSVLCPELSRSLSEDFFVQLGKQGADEVVHLQQALAGADISGEIYLDKVGRLNAAKAQAEEIITKELLTPAEEDWEDIDDFEEGLSENQKKQWKIVQEFLQAGHYVLDDE